MSSISITKQCNELDNYTQIKEYIDRVLDNFNDLDKLDSNDLYEITYVKKLCESKLAQGIENDGTRAAFEDTLARISLITDLLNDDIIKKAMNNNLDKNKVNKVNSSKHAKSNKVPNLPDKSKPKFGNPVHEYGKRIIAKSIIMTFMIIFLLNGQNITRGLINSFNTIMIDGEQSVNEEISNTHDTINSEITGSNINSKVNTISSLMNTIIYLMTIIMLCISSISMVLDIMYIAFPWFRVMMDDRKADGIENKSSFVSGYAIEAVQSADTVVGYQYSNSDDKMQASKVLLDNMLHSLRKPENRNDTSEEHIGNLLRIKNRINRCKNDYDKIKSLADVEVYYINNRVYLDKILDLDEV